MVSGPACDHDKGVGSGNAARQDAVARALLAHGSELVGLQSMAGTLLYVNPVVRRVLGYEPGEVTGRPVFDFIHPEDAPFVVAAQASLVERGGIGPGMETRVRHADGSWRLLDIVSTNLLDDPTVQALLFIARDVTERREAERLAREREASFRLLAENATDMITRTDVAGQCLYASPSSRAVLGFEPAELVGQKVATLIRPDDDSAYEQAREMIELGATTFTITHQVRRRDGRPIWLESTSRVIRDPASGAVTEVQSSARDVSDRIHSEERFEALVRNSSDIITILDADGSWRYSSPAGTRLLGWPAGYEPEGGILSLVHPDDVDLAVNALGEVLDGSRGPDAPVVFRGRGTDGRYRYFETTGQNLLDHPAVAGIVLNSRDVTDRREAEERYRKLIEAAPDGIVIIDHDGVIRLINAQTEALFGHARDDLLGRSIEVLVPERLRDAHERHRATFIADPAARPMGVGLDLLGLHRDGHEFPVEVSLSPFSTDETRLVLAVIRDMTERRETQRELQRRAVEVERLASLREREHLEVQLERARRFESLGRLAGGVAHDVNTLIGIVMIYLNSITDQLDGDARRRADADQIRAAIRRIGRLTRQLLEYGRRGEMPLETFDPDTVIPELLELARTMGATVRLVHHPAECSVLVRMPRARFEQMLINVLANAYDATPAQGIVTVTTDAVSTDALCGESGAAGPSAGQRCVRLRVADTGSGMTPEVAETAFEPFVTTRGDAEGTGLGLAIVQGIAQDAGGTASLDSRPGEGTVVTMLIPAADAAADVTEPPAPH